MRANRVGPDLHRLLGRVVPRKDTKQPDLHEGEMQQVLHEKTPALIRVMAGLGAPSDTDDEAWQRAVSPLDAGEIEALERERSARR